MRFYLTPDIQARPARLFISPPSTSASRAPSALALGATSIYSKPSCAISAQILLHREIAAGTSWRPASGRQFFWLRKARLAILGGADAWYGSSEEIEFSIDNGGVEDSVGAYEHYTYASPTLYFSHLLRVLGPSSLTLYEHVLGRRRILITRICPSKRRFLCQVAADLYFEDDSHDPDIALDLKGELDEGIDVLGVVMLHNLDMLKRESHTDRGWIAGMTDAVFLEKPQYHGLVIDRAPRDRAPRPAVRSRSRMRAGRHTASPRCASPGAT